MNKIISEMVAGHKKVLLLTASTISCTVKGMSAQMKIAWSGYDETDGDFVSSAGQFDSSNSQQIGTLSIAASAVNIDKEYTCTVSSANHPTSDTTSVIVNLHTYGTSKLSSHDLDLKPSTHQGFIVLRCELNF